MANIQPYRNAAMVPENKAPQFGMLTRHVTKPAKPHFCSTPWIIGLHFRWLFQCPIPYGSLWRCQKCGDVWRLGYYYKYIQRGYEWEPTDIKAWEEAGGRK